MKQTLLPALLMLLMGCHFVTAWADAPADTRSAPPTIYTFPFTTPYGAPVVQVKIHRPQASGNTKFGDDVTALFVIDTGAGSNAISDTLVAKMGLKSQPALNSGAAFLVDGKPAQMVTPLNLQVGGLELESGTFLIVKAKTLAAITKSKIDGIISMQVLRYFALDIDYAQHQITMLYPGGLTKDAVKDAGFGGASLVPLISSIPDSVLNNPAKSAASATYYWDLTYSLPVQISDGTHNSRQVMLLDTGSSGTIFPAEVSKNLSLKVSQTLTTPTVSEGDNIIDSVIAPRLQIGDQIGGPSLTNQPVFVSHTDAAHHIPVLGNDVLNAYHLLMDFEAKKIYLMPPHHQNVQIKLP